MSQKKLLVLESYNATMGGNVTAAEHIQWGGLTRSECKA